MKSAPAGFYRFDSRPGIGMQCMKCRHLTSYADRTCSAYSEEIPYPIWSGRADHAAPYPGDHGVIFEPRVRTRTSEPATA